MNLIRTAVAAMAFAAVALATVGAANFARVPIPSLAAFMSLFQSSSFKLVASMARSVPATTFWFAFCAVG